MNMSSLKNAGRNAMAAALLAATVAPAAHAALTLTPAGTAMGFTLSTFLSGVPNSSGIGPLAIGFNTSGNVLVSDFPNGNENLFPTDADGQVWSAGSPVAGTTDIRAIARVGGLLYASQFTAGDVVQLNQNGTINQTIVSGVTQALGIAASPNGHLFVGGNTGFYDVDPIAKTSTLVTNQITDGVSVSPDGSVAYGEINNHILGFNTTSHGQVFDSGLIPGADGSFVAIGILAGNIFVNTNNGTLVEVNLGSSAQTIIANGGSRGDFATIDPNATLLLTQTDSVIRLAGGGFGPSAVPLPSGFGGGMFAAIAAGGFAYGRKRLAV